MCHERINPDDVVTADDGVIEQEFMFPEEDTQPSLLQLWWELLTGLHPATYAVLLIMLCVFVAMLDQYIFGLHIH